MRLILLPNLHRLWRDSHTVQIGTDPARAVVVEFASPGAARLLDLLDGTRTRADLLHHAEQSRTIAPADAAAVLDALLAAGLVVPAADLLPPGLPHQVRQRLAAEATALALHRPDQPAPTPAAPATPPHPTGPATTAGNTPATTAGDATAATGSSGPTTPAEAVRRRMAARIAVTGTGSLVAPIAVALAGAGIGHVDPVVDGLGRPADLAVLIGRAAEGTRVAPIRAGAATLAVRVGSRPPTAAAGRARRSAVLNVTIRDCVVLVGPLVGPGGSPCGHCLDLHRRDSDPRWPVLAAQLATDRGPAEHTCALTTTLAAAACAADEALRYVDGRQPRTTGALIEISRPGEARRRSWPAHPRCGCRRGGQQRQVTPPELHFPPMPRPRVEMMDGGDPK